MEEKSGSRQVLINKAGLLSDVSERKQPSGEQILYLKLQKNLSPAVLSQLKAKLNTSRGEARVILYYEQDRKSMKLAQSVAPTHEFLSEIRG